MLTATILLVAEFCQADERHIVSVFKIIQELLAPSNMKGKNKFQALVELLPDEHKAKWFAGAALNTSEQSMSSVMSTALSRLNSFLDSELEQILCFDTEIDAEEFCNQKKCNISYYARGRSKQVLYDFTYHSTAIQRNPFGC